MHSVVSMLSPAIIKKTRMLCNTTLVSTTILLASCGVKDSDSAPVVYQGAPADNVTTESLQRNASNATGTSLGTAMTGVIQTISGSAALGKMFSVPGLGLSSSPAAPGALNDATQPGPQLSTEFERRVREDSTSVFGATLGLSGEALSTRNGNTITIDPDENEICADESISDALGQSSCTQLLADLTVNLNAISDQSGTITYSYRNQPVMDIGYSPISGSFELKLAGLNSMLTRAAELNENSELVPATMSGSIKLEAHVLNATAGVEAGSFKISIPEAMSIVSQADGLDVSMAPSTIMQITADSASGTASMEIGLGALSLASKNNELVGAPLQKLIMSGLTARADLASNGNVFTMSNIGLGNGPLVLSIDSLEAMRATLDTFGFTVNQSSNAITLSGDMNLAVSMRNVLRYFDTGMSPDSSANYSIKAGSGTVFSELVSGAMRIEQGGPLVVDVAEFDGSVSTNSSVSVQAGQCFGDDAFSDAPIKITDCN